MSRKTIGALAAALLAVLFAACSSPPPPPPAPRAPRVELEYPADDVWQVLPDRVIQGEKTAIAVSSTEITSTYTGRERSWSLREDIGALPSFSSPGAALFEALYNLALEEALQDIRGDGAFMAGKKWTGVWTRDISYAIHLSLAHILPENSRVSLLAKVNEYGEIIQDTGTGGSWPVSTDRIVWAIAAWELYLAQGDDGWLKQAWEILGTSLERDLANAVDPATGLLFGETSFLDWREQSYPRWMEPKDIFESKAFSTNLLFARALDIYGKMSAALGYGELSIEYLSLAARQYDLIDRFFPLDDGLYPLYLYPPIQGSIATDRSGTLSNALAVLFSASEDSPARGLWTGEITSKLPAVPFGVPVFEPQLPRIPPYHNSGIWPFVEAYYGLAAAREGNLEAYAFALDAMSRSAALFLSHMENMVYDNGHSSGTQINSERQLWSVAGYLGMVYKGLFGIRPELGGLAIRPTVPDILSDGISLSGYRLRGITVNISISGSGTTITRMTVNGEEHNGISLIPWETGDLDIEIEMSPDPSGETGAVNRIASGIVAPLEPQVGEIENGAYPYRNLTAGVETLVWDGESFTPADADLVSPAPGVILSLATRETRADGPSILSNLGPWLHDVGSEIRIPVSVEPWVQLTADPGQILAVAADLPASGRYYLCFEYANGNGPVNTDNRNAIRSLFHEGSRVATIVLPQRGSGDWGNYGLSSGVILDLEAGKQEFALRYLPENRNMNGPANEARVRALVLIPVE
jgi:hypothetical protein